MEGKKYWREYHQRQSMIRQRFTIPLAFEQTTESLVAAMLGAVVVTLEEATPEERIAITEKIDRVRVWQP